MSGGKKRSLMHKKFSEVYSEPSQTTNIEHFELWAVNFFCKKTP